MSRLISAVFVVFALSFSLVLEISNEQGHFFRWNAERLSNHSIHRERLNNVSSLYEVNHSKVPLVTDMPACLSINAADRSSDNGKPYLILHLGPPKTGTTTLQLELTTFKKALAKDNYFYAGKLVSKDSSQRLKRIIENVDCHEQVYLARIRNQKAPECWQKMLSILDLYRKDNTSITVSEESLAYRWKKMGDMGYTPLDWISLQRDLGQHWNILLVVTYRYFFEWLPSAKQQRDRKPWKQNRWPPKGQDIVPFIDEAMEHPYVSEKPIYHLTAHSNVGATSDWTQITLENVLDMVPVNIPLKIMNLHSNETLRSIFLCNILPNATNSCHLSRTLDHSNPEPYHNAGGSLFYNVLASAAVKAFMVNTTKYSKRMEVIEAIQHYQENTLNRTSRDFPLVCPNDNQIQKLFRASHRLHSRVMAGFSSGEEHRERFDQALQKGLLCWIDTKTTLDADEWQSFFRGYK